MLTAFLTPDPVTAADDLGQVAAAVKRIPALRGLALSPITALPNAPGAYTVKLGSKAVDALVVGARRQAGGPIWVAALSIEARTARELFAPDLATLPGGGGTLLAQFALVDTVVVLSEHEGELRVPEMPAVLRPRLQRLGLPSGPIALRPGVNVLASVRVAVSGPVGDLVKTLGIAAPLAPLTGSLPTTSAAALVGPGLGPTRADEVDLTLHLPPIQPPGLEAILGSDPLALTIKGDKGRLVAGGATTLRLHGPGGGAVTAQATLAVDPSPAEGGAFFRLGGSAGPLAAILPPLPVPGLAVDQLTLELALLRKGQAREPFIGFHGKGRLSGQVLDLTATLTQTPDRRTDVTLAVATDLKLSDLLDHAVPGLDGVMLRRVSLGRGHIGGTVRLGTKDISALVYTPAGKSKPNLAIGDAALALTDFVPPLRGTPLADLALANGVLLVVPPDNAARGLTAASLPVELVTLLGGPQADVLARGIDLRAGVSVLATLDVSRSKPLHALLDAVGVTATRLPLAGSLDPELFRHTPWSGGGGAGALARSFLDHLDVAIPLPALTLPGGGSALHLTQGALAVKGDKGQLWLGIQTGAEIALPDRKLTVTPLTLTAASSGVTLAGTITGTSHAGGDVKQLVAFPGLTVTAVTFAGQVDAQRRLSAGVTATGTLNLPGGPKTIGLKVALDSGDPKAGSVQVTTALKVNDFTSAPIPGIGDLTLTGLTLTPTWVSGTVRFRNEETTLLAWTPPGARGHRFALLHDRLKIGTYVPAVAGTALGDLELDRAAMIYVPAGGGATGVAADALPAPLVDRLGGKGAAAFPLDLPEGLTVSALARPPTSGPAEELLGGLGLGQQPLPLRGTLDPAYLAAGRRGAGGKWPRFDVALHLPPFRPPGTGDHVHFDKGQLVARPNPDGTFRVALACAVTLTLDTRHVLQFTGEFTRARPGVLSFAADAKTSLKAPFGIQWLSLDELDVAATIDRARGAMDLSVGGRTGIAGHSVTVTLQLVEQGGKLQDVVFALKGQLPLSVVPGLGRLPGIGALVVVDPEISRTHLAGELDFRGGKIRAALFSDGAGWNALLETTALRFDQLFPALEHGPLKAVSLPQAALLVSERGFTQKLDALAPAIQQMLGALGLKAGDPVIAVAGVNIVTTLDPSRLTGPLKQALDHLGIKDPMVLGGAVGGIFGGPPSLNLVAVLPRMPTPPVKFLHSRPSADARLLLSLAPTELRVGIGTDILVHVGQDELTFSGDLGLVINPTTIALDVTGRMQGQWHNPLGLKGVTLEAVSLTVGGELTGAVDLAVGGQVRLGSNDVLVAAGASLLVEALGAPKAIGFVGKVDRLPFGALVDRATEFVLAETGARPPDGDHPREAVELDQVLVAFMTPGVVLDPKLVEGAHLEIQGAGLALAAQLRLDGKPLGRISGWASTRGLKLDGQVAPFDIGPLRVEQGVVDVQLSTTGLPRFHIKTKADPLGARVALDLSLDSKGIAFTTRDRIGGLFDLDLVARTTQGFSLKNNDFKVDADLRTGFLEHLRELLHREMTAIFADLDAGERKLAAELDQARATVAERERDDAAARRQAERELQHLAQDVNQVRARLAQLDAQASTLRAQVARDLAAVKRAVQDLRLFRAAEMRADVRLVQVELAGVEIAHAATDRVLAAIQAGVQAIPLEADPRVLAALGRLEGARAHAALLELALRAARAIIADLRAAASRLEQLDVLEVQRARVDGSLGTTLRVAVDARLFGKENVTAAGSFAPRDAVAKAGSILAAAKELATRLLVHKKLEHEHPPEPSAATAQAPAAPGRPTPPAPAVPTPPAPTGPTPTAAAPGGAGAGDHATPGSLMSYDRWMKLTAATGKPRSAQLRAIDRGLQAYEGATDAAERQARRTDLEEALAQWKLKEGTGWKSSVRNKEHAVEILDAQLRAPATAIALSKEEREALAFVNEQNLKNLERLFTGKKLVLRATTALGAVKAAHARFKAARAAAGSQLPADPDQRVSAVDEVLAAVLGQATGEVADKLKDALKDVIKDLLVDALPILGTFKGVFADLREDWMATAKAAWTAHKLRRAKEAFAPGDPAAAFDAVVSILDRETAVARRKAGLTTVSFGVEALLTATGAGAVGAPVVAATKALAEVLGELHELAEDAHEAEAANARIAQDKLDLHLFDTAPLLGAYLLAISDTSAVVNMTVAEFGAPGWVFEIENLVNKAAPVFDKATDLILSATYEIPELRNMKGSAVNRNDKTLGVPTGKLAALKQRMIDWTNRVPPPSGTPTRPTGGPRPPAVPAVSPAAEGPPSVTVCPISSGTCTVPWNRWAKTWSPLLTRPAAERPASWGPCASPSYGADPKTRQPYGRICAQVVVGARHEDLRPYHGCPGYITMNAEEPTEALQDQFMACAVAGQLGGDCTVPIKIVPGPDGVPDPVRVRQLAQLRACRCTLDETHQKTGGFVTSCPTGRQTALTCPAVPGDCRLFEALVKDAATGKEARRKVPYNEWEPDGKPLEKASPARKADWAPCKPPPAGGCRQVVLGRFPEINQYHGCPGYIVLNTTSWTPEVNDSFIACAAAGRLGATCNPPIKIVSGWARIDHASVTLREMLQLRRCGCGPQIGEDAYAEGEAGACPRTTWLGPLLSRLLPWLSPCDPLDLRSRRDLPLAARGAPPSR